MNDFKFVELPKEEVLSEVELSFIEGASNCVQYEDCGTEVAGKRYCGCYDMEPCSDGCNPGLYCAWY